ncbi:hypothetical protein MMC13_000533 [Lambiella insularis]|nr:hypothetical protein [Lambiella insularis]
MGDRSSSSGVRNLRAMFEDREKSEDTPSPSRGRSPVGSEQDAASRPISKVRTSFVAVERSGVLGPQLGLRKISDTGSTAMDIMGPADELKASKSRTDAHNGTSSSEPEDVHADGTNSVDQGDKKPMTEEAEPSVNTIEMTPSVVPETQVEDATSAPGATSDDLEEVLKGSSFEEEKPATDIATTPATEASEAATSTPPAEATPEKSTKQDQPSKMNGTLHKLTPKQTQAKASSKLTPNKLPGISTKKDANQGQNSSKASPLNKSVRDQKPKSPKTPSGLNEAMNSKHSSPKQVISKTNSPKQDLPDKSASRTSIGGLSTVPRTGRISGVKGPESKRAPSNAAQTSKKPTPKSPTRPVRLPAAATAPTAASAAKLGSDSNVPARSPSRAGTMNTNLGRKASTLKKPTATSKGGTSSAGIATRSYPKSSHASLPNGSHPTDHPKPRVSTAGSKQPEEGFLARMMRPTASSASKAHEKIEPKSPPRKSQPTKLKRKSAVEEGTPRPGECEEKADRNETEKTSGIANGA